MSGSLVTWEEGTRQNVVCLQTRHATKDGKRWEMTHDSASLHPCATLSLTRDMFSLPSRQVQKMCNPNHFWQFHAKHADIKAVFNIQILPEANMKFLFGMTDVMTFCSTEFWCQHFPAFKLEASIQCYNFVFNMWNITILLDTLWVDLPLKYIILVIQYPYWYPNPLSSNNKCPFPLFICLSQKIADNFPNTGIYAICDMRSFKQSYHDAIYNLPVFPLTLHTLRTNYTLL